LLYWVLATAWGSTGTGGSKRPILASEPVGINQKPKVKQMEISKIAYIKNNTCRPFTFYVGP